MTTQASIGYGALFALFDNADYVTLAEVTLITPPNLSVDSVDAVHTESPSATREYIAGLIDPGELKVEMNYVPRSATDQLCLAKLAARQPVQWRITFPEDGGSPNEEAIGSGIITGYETSIPLDDKMMATLTIKISGPVSYN